MKLSRQPAAFAPFAAIAPLAALALLLLSISCGGGGGSSGPPPPPPPPPDPLKITTSSLPGAIVGNNYSQQLQATGGTPPYRWSLSVPSPPMPPGLTLSSGGIVSGIPSQAAGDNFLFQVNDSMNRAATQMLNLSVAGVLTITTGTLPYGFMTRDYTQTFSGIGGTLPYTWSLAPGSSLPPGLSIFPSGVLMGTLISAGSYSFTLQLADSDSQSSTKAFTLEVFTGPLLTRSPFTLPAGISGQPYSFAFQVTGGTPPYIWDLPLAAIYPPPPGMTLSTNTGELSGTPVITSSGSWGIRVRVTDAAGHSDEWVYSLTLVTPLTLLPATLPDGNVGIPYSQWLPYTGGWGPQTWGLAAGSGPLPLGLSMPLTNSTISGTPTAPGTFSFTVELHDGLGEVATQGYSILIKNDVIITTSTLPYGVVSKAYPQQTLAVVGGSPPYTWSVAGGNLPIGLSLDPATGQITGTPSLAGTFDFDLLVQDSSVAPQVGTTALSILIRPPLSIVTARLPDAVTNIYYSASIQADGGTFPPYSIRITSGALPGGMAVGMGNSSDGNGYFFVSGTPSALGVSNFTIEVSDRSSPPATVSKDFSIRVNPLLLIDPGTGSLPSIIEGQSFSYTVLATGGVPPYTWSLQSPIAGMSIDPSTGVFSGAPTQRNLNGVAFVLEDNASPPQRASQFMSWYVAELLRVRTSFFPTLAAGAPVNIIVSVTGGSCCVYDWSISSGSLPPGLRLLSSQIGEILGTPTTPGTYNFTLLVKDGATGPLSQSISKPMSIDVKAQGQLGRNDSIATATPLSNGSGCLLSSLKQPSSRTCIA